MSGHRDHGSFQQSRGPTRWSYRVQTTKAFDFWFAAHALHSHDPRNILYHFIGLFAMADTATQRACISRTKDEHNCFKESTTLGSAWLAKLMAKISNNSSKSLRYFIRLGSLSPYSVFLIRCPSFSQSASLPSCILKGIPLVPIDRLAHCCCSDQA